MTTPNERRLDPATTGRTGTPHTHAGDPDAVGVTSSGGAHEVRADGVHTHDDRDVVAPRDMVRWGPLWAGVMVALAAYLVLQLAVFALDLYSDEGAWWSSISALVAFFIGGLVVGATALWHGAGQGAVNGAVMWAFATVGLLLLAVLGGGTLAGPVSTVAADLGAIQDLNLQNPPADQVNQALQGARDAAGWALLGLGSSLVASVAGGVAGAKIWPGRGTPGTTSQDAVHARTR
jgi:hypothetical protein